MCSCACMALILNCVERGNLKPSIWGVPKRRNVGSTTAKHCHNNIRTQANIVYARTHTQTGNEAIRPTQSVKHLHTNLQGNLDHTCHKDKRNNTRMRHCIHLQWRLRAGASSAPWLRPLSAALAAALLSSSCSLRTDPGDGSRMRWCSARVATLAPASAHIFNFRKTRFSSVLLLAV